MNIKASVWGGLRWILALFAFAAAVPVQGQPPGSPPMVSLPWEEPLLPGPIYSTRELLWKASLVVSLKVAKTGELEVEKVNLGEWSKSEPPPLSANASWPKGALRGIAFFRSGKSQYELLPSGLRLEGPADTVEVALGGSSPQPIDGSSWQDLQRSVRLDGEKVRQLKLAWVDSSGPRRLTLLRDWVEREEKGFGGGITEGRQGWGSLEASVLMELISQDSLESSWKAVGIYARANQGHLPPCGPFFSSPSRRQFLLNLLQNPVALQGEQIRALKILSQKTVWPAPVDAGEAQKFFNTLSIGFKKGKGPWFEASMEILGQPALGPGPVPKDLTRELVLLYQAKPPGPEKQRLAKTLSLVLGEQEWKTLSGNPGQLVVAITQWNLDQDRLVWQCERLQGSVPATKAFFLREKIDEMGKVQESATAPLRGTDNPPWDFTQIARGEEPVSTWNSGTWRVKIVGGDPKSPLWQSETRLLKVIKPIKLFPFGPGNPPKAKIQLDPVSPEK